LAQHQGFTLIELMIVIAIIAIIVAIAMPNLLESKKSANEASAISALRTISSSQELYRARYSAYGSFDNLHNHNLIDVVLRDADSAGAASAKAGYLYTLSTNGIDWWCCVAYPLSWGNGGDRKFRITGDGVLYQSADSSSNAFAAGGTPLGR
jgi:prepilin-type N-terminal cleavage/methylation domain-containing protein